MFAGKQQKFPLARNTAMRLKIISLGKIRQTFVREGEEEFAKRIRAWLPIECIELPVEKFAALPEAQLKAKEAALLLKHLRKDDYVVALDEHGRAKSSREFAHFLATHMHGGEPAIVFAVGGANGWDDAVKKRANLLLSLSPMTFTYQMSRLVLIEQIYRALTIVRNVPYHK